MRHSISGMIGYAIRATDGDLGNVDEFYFDDEVLLPPQWIKRVESADSSVHFDLTRESVKNSPEFNPSQAIGTKSKPLRVLKFRPKTSPYTLRRRRLRRLHWKIVVVDRKIGFVGGIKIIDDDTPDQTSRR